MNYLHFKIIPTLGGGADVEESGRWGKLRASAHPFERKRNSFVSPSLLNNPFHPMLFPLSDFCLCCCLRHGPYMVSHDHLNSNIIIIKTNIN